MEKVKLKIDVTDEDIELGEKCKSSDCPIARACKRAGLKNTFEVLTSRILIGEKVKHEIFLPLEATRFIDFFDSDKPVKPFSFTIEVDKSDTV